LGDLEGVGEELPKKGIQGGLARWSVSRYSAKFLVLPISLRMLSRTPMERWLTALQVRFRRWIGAVPRAEMIDVSVEKLFNWRHFWVTLAVQIAFCCRNLHQPRSQSAL
jgi:hypothetical protein